MDSPLFLFQQLIINNYKYSYNKGIYNFRNFVAYESKQHICHRTFPAGKGTLDAS